MYLQVVHHATGRADDKVRVAAQRLELVLHRVPAYQQGHAQVRKVAETSGELDRLHRQLPRRGEDQRAGPHPRRVRAQLFEHGDQEGGRLARPCAGHAHDVLPRQRLGEGLALHGCGEFVAHAVHSRVHFLAQAQRLERALGDLAALLFPLSAVLLFALAVILKVVVVAAAIPSIVVVVDRMELKLWVRLLFVWDAIE